jgi:hypothetical protein
VAQRARATMPTVLTASLRARAESAEVELDQRSGMPRAPAMSGSRCHLLPAELLGQALLEGARVLLAPLHITNLHS